MPCCPHRRPQHSNFSIPPPRTFSPAVVVSEGIPLILARVIKRIRYREFIDLALLMGGIIPVQWFGCTSRPPSQSAQEVHDGNYISDHLGSSFLMIHGSASIHPCYTT